MSSVDSATLKRLRGGSKWHCPSANCSYVERTDLGFDSDGIEATWDPEQQSLRVEGASESIRLSDVCNQCRKANGWQVPWPA